MNKISADTYRKYANDSIAFIENLTIDVDGTPRRFGDEMDDWQRTDFDALVPAMKRCSGHSDDSTAKMRAYLERGRGHSKTTDIAVICIWMMAFASRPLKGYAFAADKEQADLVRQSVETIIRLNPWLSAILEVQKNVILNIAAHQHPGNGSTLTIFTSDVGSSYGLLADFIVCDELTHWEGDGSLWHSIISTAAKRKNCLLLVISNAGFQDSWQWSVREAAREAART